MDSPLPSRAAILTPSTAVGSSDPTLQELLTATLRARRYDHHAPPLPRGYRPAEREWLAFDLRASGDGRFAVLACEHVGLVFEIALWLAAAHPARPFLAWRHLRGAPPVLKVYGKGRPLYRVGPDEDRELGWHLPSRPPADRPSAHDLGLPATPADLVAAGGDALAPYPRHGAPFLGFPLAFLRTDSHLAQR